MEKIDRVLRENGIEEKSKQDNPKIQKFCGGGKHYTAPYAKTCQCGFVKWE